MEYGKIKPAGGRGAFPLPEPQNITYQGGNVYETHQQENHCNEHGNHDGRKRRLPHQRPDIHCGGSPFREDRRQRRTPGQQEQKRPGFLSLPLRRTSGPPAYRRRMPLRRRFIRQHPIHHLRPCLRSRHRTHQTGPAGPKRQRIRLRDPRQHNRRKRPEPH